MTGDEAQDLRGFPLTNWSQVRRAGQPEGPAVGAALEELLRRYRPALQAHLVVVKRIPPERAEDLLHDFIENKVLSGALLSGADPLRGKFRTYVLTALDRFIVSAARKDAAQKRTPAGGFIDLEEVSYELAETRPATAGDVEWARQVIGEALRRVQAECEGSGRAAFWQVFELRMVGPLLEGTPPPPYEDLVRRCGFQSPTQASNALLTVKRMFARVLRAVVTEYSRSETEVDAELQELRQILSEAGA